MLARIVVGRRSGGRNVPISDLSVITQSFSAYA
jgi:hypothetical protein